MSTNHSRRQSKCSRGDVATSTMIDDVFRCSHVSRFVFRSFDA